MAHRARAAVGALCLALLSLSSCLYPVVPGPNDVVFRSPYLAAILKLPADFDSTRTFPLLIALHGNGGNAVSLAPWFSHVARASFFVAVPEGPYVRESGGYSWFFETDDRALWEQYDTVSVRAVVALIEALRTEYRIGDVYLLGFSQGASLAYMTGFRNPELVDGLLAISGVLPDIDTLGAIVHAQDIEAARNVPVFVARGAEDEMISRRSFLTQVEFLTSHGYAVTAYEYSGGHVLTDDVTNRALLWMAEHAGP